jgi:hypothetical protein
MTLADRLIDLNHWYEGLPDGRRVFVYPAVLVVAGYVNTRLTGAPIGLVSLSALVALVAVRRSYISGWLAARVPAGGAVPDARYPAVAETVAPAAKPESFRRVGADLPNRDTVVPHTIVADRKGAEPAAAPFAPVVARAAAPAAVQPVAPAVPEKAVPVQDVPATKPVARVEAATATPPSAPAHDSHEKGGKRSTETAAPAARKAQGKSGKRKPGDKHDKHTD